MTPVLEISGIHKTYQSLRPLRMQALSIAPGERVAISGLDGPAAEVLVNLVTGASLPDHGEVRVLGRATSEIADGNAWLASLDRFGIVSPRGVLLDGVTVVQNIAMVFTLEIEPVPPETAERASALARECGIEDVSAVTGQTSADVRARVHLARAVALEPALLLLEHPTLGIDEAGKDPLAADIATVADRRKLTTLVVTQDDRFAARVAHRALRLEPATGALKPVRRGWFG